MAKSEQKTGTIAWLVYGISVLAFLATAILFILWYFLEFKENEESHKPSDHDMYLRYYATSLLSYFLTGHGIMMFRVARRSMPIIHGILHTVVLAILVFDRIDGSKNAYPSAQRFSLSTDIALGIYVIQFIGSFHFMVFRTGLSELETQCRAAIHAFIGVLTFLVLYLDVVLRLEGLAINEMALGEESKKEYFDWYHIVMSLCVLIYATCVLFIILMPQYEWNMSKAKFECFLPGKIRNKNRKNKKERSANISTQ